MQSASGRLGSTGAEAEALPSWLPLYLVLLAAATFSPLWLHCAPHPWVLRPHLADVFQNLLLFAPLGAALGRRRLLAVLVLAIVSSGGIELAQRWLPRYASPWDIVANASGAGLGWCASAPLARWIERALRPRILVPLAVVALSVTLAGRGALPPNDFSNWESFPLMIGDERTGSRPWSGHIREIAVYDRAIHADSLPPETATPPHWREGGPILWLRFAPPVAGRLDGPEGPVPVEVAPPVSSGAQLEADGLRTQGGLWLLPESWAAHLSARLTASERIAVAARLRPADLEARGPARVLSMSGSALRRNFTLGQDGRDLVLRVRTPATGDNGHRPQTATFGGPLSGEMQQVTAVFDGELGRIEVDGRCGGDTWLALARTPDSWGAGIAFTIALCTALGALAASSVDFLRLAPAARAPIGAAASFALLVAGGAWDHLPDYGLRAAALAGAAALGAVALARGRRLP